MDEDAFETVAITWSQPEAAVMLAMFAFYGIPAYALGRWHASAHPVSIVALQGMAIRVAVIMRDDVLDLLAEVAERPAAVRPYPGHDADLYRASIGLLIVLTVLGTLIGNAWLATLAGTPLSLWMAVAPPTRTASEFMLWKRGAPGDL